MKEIANLYHEEGFSGKLDVAEDLLVLWERSVRPQHGSLQARCDRGEAEHQLLGMSS